MGNSANRPSNIIATGTLAEQLETCPGGIEHFGFVRPIGMTAGLMRLRLDLERLPPGHRLDWPTALEHEEQFVLVQEGEVDAWIDGETYPMKQSDFAAFPAGTGISHTFINNSAHDAILLVGGERPKIDGRISYPLNPEAFDDVSLNRNPPFFTQWADVPERPLGSHDARPTQIPALASSSLSLKSGLQACKNNTQRTRGF